MRECSRAGIRVHYCGEQFDNDGSIGPNLLRTMKRVMAGKYSRELSVEVFAGQCRLVELGFRQGGEPGYGPRRAAIARACRRIASYWCPDRSMETFSYCALQYAGLFRPYANRFPRRVVFLYPPDMLRARRPLTPGSLGIVRPIHNRNFTGKSRDMWCSCVERLMFLFG